MSHISKRSKSLSHDSDVSISRRDLDSGRRSTRNSRKESPKSPDTLSQVSPSSSFEDMSIHSEKLGLVQSPMLQSKNFVHALREYAFELLRDFGQGLRRHSLPLAVSMLFFIVASYFNTFFQVYVQNRVIDLKLDHMEPLFDSGFEYFTDLSSFENLPDFWISFMAVAVFVKSFLRLRFSCLMLVMKRYFFIHGCVFFLRGISIAVTFLPNPWRDSCVPIHFDNIWLDPILIMMGQKRTCYDVLFSGHSALVTLTTLTWIQYETNSIIQMLSIPVAIGGCFVLIATRFHYTVDVFFGSILAAGCWGTYHYGVRRLRELTFKRYRSHGDFDSSSITEWNSDCYTPEEKTYLKDLDRQDDGWNWSYVYSVFNQRSTFWKRGLIRCSIYFFSWFECWQDDVKDECDGSLLPMKKSKFRCHSS